MRIVSLLPSATEIICKLGLADQLVGVSHECDKSEIPGDPPAITSPKYAKNGTSLAIDQSVKSLVEQGLSVFNVDTTLLRDINPDIVLTQDHCEVCAVPYSDVYQAVQLVCSNTSIVSISPTTLAEVIISFERIGLAVDAEAKAKRLIDETHQRFNIIRQTVVGEHRKRIIALEWLEPLMTGGNWIPELMEISGGDALLAEPGKHSPFVNWENIIDENPDIILLMPCGYSLEQTRKEFHLLTNKPDWKNLKAVQKQQVFILEGNRFFNRPGPSLYESARILGEVIHPHLFQPTLLNNGWINSNSTP